jgi:hypothetical protein
MIHLENSTREEEEKWLSEQVKKMKAEERIAFLRECANYLLLIDKYSERCEKADAYLSEEGRLNFIG